MVWGVELGIHPTHFATFIPNLLSYTRVHYRDSGAPKSAGTRTLSPPPPEMNANLTPCK